LDARVPRDQHRRDDVELRRTLDAALTRRRAAIDALLRDYGIEPMRADASPAPPYGR